MYSLYCYTFTTWTLVLQILYAILVTSTNTIHRHNHNHTTVLTMHSTLPLYHTLPYYSITITIIHYHYRASLIFPRQQCGTALIYNACTAAAAAAACPCHVMSAPLPSSALLFPRSHCQGTVVSVGCVAFYTWPHTYSGQYIVVARTGRVLYIQNWHL